MSVDKAICTRCMCELLLLKNSLGYDDLCDDVDAELSNGGLFPVSATRTWCLENTQ